MEYVIIDYNISHPYVPIGRFVQSGCSESVYSSVLTAYSV